MFITDKNIEKVLSEFYNEDELPMYYCFGTTREPLNVYSLPESFILGFTNKNLIMVKLNFMNNPKETRVVSYRKFMDVEIFNWSLGMGKKFKIYLNDGEIIEFNLPNDPGSVEKQKKISTPLFVCLRTNGLNE